MAFLHFILVIFTFFSIVFGSENSTKITNATLYSDFSPNEEFEQFWRSVGRFEKASNENYAKIAEEIHQIADQLNRTSSQCYQIIEKTFRTGLKKDWSSKCEFLSRLILILELPD